ncbi:DegV family protein [Enterococcus faecium]|nr:DegV family protein [Enterococcus faecium]
MKNNKIAILVDSGTDVPEELIKKYEMYMIPLKIIYKDQVYTDKIDITLKRSINVCQRKSLVHLCRMVSQSQKSLSKSKKTVMKRYLR